MKTKVFYDYFDGHKVPIWFVVKIEDDIDWTQEYIYLPIEAPFEVLDRGDFDPDMMSASVTMGDLTQSTAHANTIGIYLPRLKQTIHDFGGSLHEVQQLIIQVSDIEEVLQLNTIREHLEW